MNAADLEAALDALFAAGPQGFMASRDALVKELKAAGNKEGAAAVKALHKPTLVADALNRLVREAKPEIEALLEAGQALAGGKDFKAAVERQRVALEALFKKATGPDVPAILSVVRSAQVDPKLAAELRLGRFSKLPDAKIGFFGAVPESSPAAVPEPATHVPQIDRTELARARAAAEKEKREAEEREAAKRAHEVQVAEKEAAKLEAEADEYEQRAKAARERSDAAAERVRSLKKKL